MRIGIERIDRDAALQARNGLAMLATSFKHIGQVVPGLGEATFNLHCKQEMLRGIVQPSLLAQPIAKIEVGFGVNRLNRDGHAIRTDRFGNITRCFTNTPVLEPLFCARSACFPLNNAQTPMVKMRLFAKQCRRIRLPTGRLVVVPHGPGLYGEGALILQHRQVVHDALRRFLRLAAG